MARALLHVQNHIYCEIDIENTPMPSTQNLIDSINIVEGFGQAVPVLQMFLYDQHGSLADELSLMEGKKITINLGKSSRQTDKREFRVFGFTSVDTHAGPMLQVTCILDVYKFIAETNTKAFAATSSETMSRVAALCGLSYDGPDSTNDYMKWLNVCQTYSSFTEDVAMHGYANAKSCMFRVLTSKKFLIYKDLFEQLSKKPEAILLHNDTPKGASAPEFLVREAKTLSRGGVISHWLNYGYAQYEHDLSGNNVENTKISAPITNGFPVNNIRNEMDFSRKDYVGLDTGLNDQPGGNVHSRYRKAKYQNTRFYGLFTDGLHCLLEQYSDVRICDPIKLNFVDYKRGSFVQNDRYSGKYILTNKTIHIKNGIRYTEKLTLSRPNVGNAQ